MIFKGEKYSVNLILKRIIAIKAGDDIRTDVMWDFKADDISDELLKKIDSIPFCKIEIDYEIERKDFETHSVEFAIAKAIKVNEKC